MSNWQDTLRKHLDSAKTMSEQELMDDAVLAVVEGLNIIQLTPEQEAQALQELLFLLAEPTEDTTIH